MTDQQFKKKMKELGWDDVYIDELLTLRDEMETAGIIFPYEANLIEAPRNYP